MFQKQTFGATTTGFGSFNSGASTSSPFSGFKATASTSAFGAPPAFGANATAQPATGGGLFGASTTNTGLFGNTATPSTFGQSSGFGFGASTSSGGLFSNNTGTGLFAGNQNNTGFGSKPTGFGFGSTTNTGTTGGIFGSTPSTSTGLFGQQNTTLGGTGLFGNTSGGFGQQQTMTGTAHVKYNPVLGTDVVVKAGTSQNVNIKHHCITCMKDYESKSLEELRLEDYVAGRKGAPGGMFGGFQQTENKPLFGGNTFGQPATTSAPSLFGTGIGSSSAFGQTNTFSFGSNNQANTSTTGLFGANKSAFGATSTTGTGLFGSTTTQAPTFGTNTSTFGGFGANTQNQPGGIFGAKPAATGFGTAATSTGFGGFGGGSLFGAKSQQTTAPTFGSTAPAFGTATGFGTNTTGSSLFGGSTFGKPATTQPSFGFNAQPTLGLGTGLGSSFQAKPAAPAFGTLGGSLFSQPAANNNTFRTGLDSGLGGGLFGGNSSLGGTGLGMGQLGTNNTMIGGGLSGASGSVHEHMLSLAARPYGDSGLFKDLVPDTSEDVLKPTNPRAVKAVLDSAAYRVISPPPPTTRLKIFPLPTSSAQEKKSLFDGLEESDPSIEDKLTLKPSRKRLVLRPKPRTEENESVDHRTDTNRSIEDTKQKSVEGPRNEPNTQPSESYSVTTARGERTKEKDMDNNNPQAVFDRHASWLGSKQSWSDKEKPMDGEPTPKLYPDLDKELPPQIPERRASWLTTKPLRKSSAMSLDTAENSARELGLRTDRSIEDKENIDNYTVSEGEHVTPCEAPPHPAGVKLTRPGYYTIPSLEEMINYIRPDGSCVVPHLTIGRKNYGNVYYDCEINVTGLDLDSLVHFLNKEVIIYPEDEAKPPVGEGLNRRAIVTLERVWPRDKTERRPISEPDRLLKMDYEGKLRRVCDKHDTKFVEYRPQTGSWVFRVEHFSKYGLTDSDEEDDITPDILKRQLVTQAVQKSAAPNQIPPVTTTAAGPSVDLTRLGLGLGGLGGLGDLGGLTNLGGLSTGGLPPDDFYAMQQTSLNLMEGSSKAFEVDAVDDSAEPHSLYDDNTAFTVKSPTSELARLEHRQSHHLQLMKASLYADADMEDDGSLSTGEQLVPLAKTITTAPSIKQQPRQETSFEDISPAVIAPSEEVIMRPLIVRPHTIVLKYHRKVPPFGLTIAGRVQAAHFADMSVCRARHARTGFGPAGALTYVSTCDAVNDLPKSADLSELGNYVSGRSGDDWSEPTVVRLAVGRAHTELVAETLSRQLASLLEFSTVADTNATRHDSCPRLVVRDSPRDRRELLNRLLDDASKTDYSSSFGVSSAYCLQVWKLCEALWGADLDNDGIPGTDIQSKVHRHKCLLQWLKDAVSEATDRELSEQKLAEPEDESDGHSAKVWSLIVGGRILEACKLSRDCGDLNMAALIAQAEGDPAFRSLVARQLHTWQECGAEPLIASSRRATLNLLAGLRPPGHLETLDWLRALTATARYLCPQIPTLEQIVRTYEAYFTNSEDPDLTALPYDEMGMQFPAPPYEDAYTISRTEDIRRVYDLRYELIRARAFNGRPKLAPAAYTPDPFDYSLSFLLEAWFGCPTVGNVVGAAGQLEAMGRWHQAVQALAFHPDETARGHLIRAVISRHAPSQADTPELKSRLELIKRLGVPEKWLLLAQAYRAKYECKPSLEVEYLVGAEQWNAAHRVLLDELLPEAVLADNLQSIKGILEKMNAAASRHEVNGWETGGQALYHYLKVCDEIRGLVSAVEAAPPPATGGAALATRLEALRPSLAAACRALRGLSPKSARHAAARAEMGARLVQLALAGGEPAPHLAALLRQLRLPPDCAAQAVLKVTSDLAEKASELCLDSTPSSPLSSHQRAVLTS